MGIKIPQSNVPSSVADEAITKEMHDGLRRATTTASILAAEQGSGNISKTKTKETPSGLNSLRTSSEGGPDKVTHLENELISTKAVYNKALITLIKRVKKFEKKLKHKQRRAFFDSSEKEKEASLDHEDSSKQGRMIEEIDKYKNVDLAKSNDETLAETLLNIKRSATKDKGEAIIKESESPKKIKKKEMMQISLDEKIAQRFYKEEQHRFCGMKNMLNKFKITQIQADKDLAQIMLMEERKSLSIKEMSRLLIEFIDKRKKMIAAKRAEKKRNKPPTQAQQRTYISNYLKNMGGLFQWKVKAKQEKEDQKKKWKKMKLFQGMQLIQKLRDDQKRMKNVFEVMSGSYVQPPDKVCFDPCNKRYAEEELGQEQKVEEEISQQEDVVAKQDEKESSKKAGGRLKRKTSKAREDKEKRQKKQDDLEKLTLMKYVEVIFDFKEVINVIPLAVKSPIVNWKSYCKGYMGYNEIQREDESYKPYIFFSEMLNDFDKEYLIVLDRLFNDKYASTRPRFNDLILWGYMKIMFKPDGDDEVWKNHHNQDLIEWKLYDSCRVHSLMLGEVSTHMLVEKKYPLPQDTLRRMLQWKLHMNYNVTEMAYELLRFIRSQLNQ
uniref:Uncharacterized protein n=1 Tax=Tanacetum cinerariifolium TaxID=118510 RepID=A0A699HB53_TANCI|nr:hypothetical protein [Tanacetum cinerariifolium]